MSDRVMPPVFERSNRLFTDDAFIDESVPTLPSLQPMLDALHQDEQKKFTNCRFYFEMQKEYIELLARLRESGDNQDLSKVMIHRPHAADQKKWQCGVVGCKYIGTAQHVQAHLRKQTHLNLQPYKCRIGCGLRFAQPGDYRRHETVCKSRLIKEPVQHSKKRPYGHRNGGKPVNVPVQSRSQDPPPAYPIQEHEVQTPYGSSNSCDTLSEGSCPHESIMDLAEMQLRGPVQHETYTEGPPPTSSEPFSQDPVGGPPVVEKTMNQPYQHNGGLGGLYSAGDSQRVMNHSNYNQHFPVYPPGNMIGGMANDTHSEYIDGMQQHWQQASPPAPAPAPAHTINTFHGQSIINNNGVVYNINSPIPPPPQRPAMFDTPTHFGATHGPTAYVPIINVPPQRIMPGYPHSHSQMESPFWPAAWGAEYGAYLSRGVVDYSTV